MSFTIACKACGEILTAESEEDLAKKGMEHGAAHGHPARAMSIEHALKRIRRHASKPR